MRRNRNRYRIHIDRLVLDGLEMTPDQAERLRPLLEAELTRRLTLGKIDGLRARRISRWEAPPVQFDFDGNDRMEGLATDLADRVMGAIDTGIAPAGGAEDV